MPYATAANVQARIPKQLCEIGPASQPSLSQVEAWLTAQSNWIDRALRWKYVTPITDADDIAVLREICAQLVASQIWDVKGSFGPDQASQGPHLRRSALETFAWDAKSGQSRLVLSDSSLSDTGEAAVMQPEGTFTDPDSEDDDVNPRFFKISDDL